MQPLNVVLAVCVLGPSVKYQPLLLLIVVAERDLDVELHLVEHFDLQAEKWLEELMLGFARILQQL